MKKFASLLSFVLVVSTSLTGQGLAGNYAITGQGGTISLKLENTIGGVQGSLKDMQGVVYTVQGEVEAGEAFGTLSTQQGALYFEAFREGNELYLTLIPVGANGQPDPSGAQEFVMTAQGKTAIDIAGNPAAVAPPGNPAAAGSMGGPLGGPSAAPANTGWAGTFSGSITGTPTTMTLQLNGGQLNGAVDASGYRYNLQGTASGNQSQGKLLDPQTQGAFIYTATLNGNQLNLTIQNPANGQSQQIVFTRGAAAAATAPGNNLNGGQAGASQQFERDTRLVGAWNYTDSYTSGEYSFATQWKLIVNPDGTYLYGDGRVVGGGPGMSGDSGSGGDVTRGQWRTENGILYVNTGAGWQAYARYTTNGQSLLLQSGDGNKQLWKRSY